MRILECDVCGKQAKDDKGITGREFETFGFKTLAHAFRYSNVVDVCPDCFAVAEKAQKEAREEVKKAERESYVRKLSKLWGA